MQRSLKRNLLFLSIALLIITASLMGARLVLVRASMQERITLNEQTAPLSQGAQVVQETARDQQLPLSVGLQLRNKDKAEQLLAAISDPTSPYYHHYLTPEQFKQWFAPTDDQVQRVMRYLREQGMKVDGVSANNLLITASTTVEQAEKSFQTRIKNYRRGKRTFHANSSAPSLPRDVGILVQSIGGLDNSMRYEPSLAKQAQMTSATQIAADTLKPTGLDPYGLEMVYDLGPLHQNGFQGQGQTVALFTLDGYVESDITSYFQSYNLPQPTIQRYLVDGVSGAAGQSALETTLDIEMLGAVAPRSTILVYEGPNTVQGINDTYAKIVNDNQAKVVSISWGLCEASMGTAQVQTLNTIFLQGALQGMSFFAASGDAGAYDCQDDNLAVDSPASDPNVTGVGATSLMINGDYSYASETPWINPDNILRGPHGAGSGGGLSAIFSRPSWQNGPGVINQYSNGMRQVPDVSAFGDPAQGFNVYCTVKNAGCPSDGWTSAGGSSVAAPFWAGSMVLINQYLQANNKSLPGSINPVLYQLLNSSPQYAGFHDVASGNNLYYPATSGYDMASGIGSLDVYNLARDLAALGSPNPTPSVTATAIATSIPTTVPTATATAMATATPIATPRPTMAPTPTPTVPPVLIQNGDFESGATIWRQSSSGGFSLIDSTNPHRGNFSAYLCGYASCEDRIWETFAVPSNYNHLVLTYWWYGSMSSSTECINTLTVRLQTPTGTLIQDAQQVCNPQATNSWKQQTVDLSTLLANYRGGSVSLMFRALNSSSQVTTFFVDDVSIALS